MNEINGAVFVNFWVMRFFQELSLKKQTLAEHFFFIKLLDQIDMKTSNIYSKLDFMIQKLTNNSPISHSIFTSNLNIRYLVINIILFQIQNIKQYMRVSVCILNYNAQNCRLFKRIWMSDMHLIQSIGITKLYWRISGQKTCRTRPPIFSSSRMTRYLL